MTTTLDRFTVARAKWIVAYDAMMTRRQEVKSKSGLELSYFHDRRYMQLEARAERLEQAFWAVLDTISPRNWRQSPIPWYWIMTALPFEDATTAGPLSVTPPPGYGSDHYDVTRWLTTGAR